MVCSSEVKNIIEHSKTPTYLKHLTRNIETILICGQKPKSFNINDDEASIEDMTFNNELDLTGNPLTLDLNGEDSVCSDIDDTVTWWTADEAKHYPINLQDARKYLNLLYRNKGKNNSGDTSKKYFCLCDGRNEEKIVIIGSCKNESLFSRTLVYDYGCFSTWDQIIKVDSMKKKHLSNANCSSSSEIDNNVFGLYSVFGEDLSNAHISTNSETVGSILIDAQWKTCEVDIPQYKSELKLKMQLIAGHTKSRMHNFWNNITILKHLIDKKLKNEVTFFENSMDLIDYKSFTELTKLISEVLNETTFKHANIVKDKASSSLSSLIITIAEVKEETIFDKLWRLLISCRDASDLKDCFSIIFEDIAQNNTSRLLIPDDDPTNIAHIVSSLYSGKMAVPNINESQALELLIELGIEKLRRDYVFIINYFHFISKDTFSEKWSEGLAPKDTKECFQPKKSLFRPTMEHLRVARTTMCPQSSMINVSECVLKLNKLTQLHISLEFLLMMEQFCSLNKPVSFYPLCSSVFERCFGLKTSIKSAAYLKSNPLCEISIPVNYEDIKLDKIHTLMWRLEMKSKRRNSEVATVFLVSNGPILPPTASNRDMSEIPFNLKSVSVLEMVTYTQYKRP